LHKASTLKLRLVHDQAIEQISYLLIDESIWHLPYHACWLLPLCKVKNNDQHLAELLLLSNLNFLTVS
jgi:hypothetical protein